MSWYITAVGRPKAVAEQVAKQIAMVKCSEPEETIKAQAGAIIGASLAAYPEASAVKILASGSQSVMADGKFINNLKIEIDPLYGFVE